MTTLRKRSQVGNARVRVVVTGADTVEVQMIAARIAAAVMESQNILRKEAPAPSGCRGCGDK
jgi:hypothetical protein